MKSNLDKFKDLCKYQNKVEDLLAQLIDQEEKLMDSIGDEVDISPYLITGE